MQYFGPHCSSLTTNHSLPGGGARALGAKSQYCGQSLRNVNVATDYFKKLKEASVPEDVKFFHKCVQCLGAEVVQRQRVTVSGLGNCNCKDSKERGL